MVAIDVLRLAAAVLVALYHLSPITTIDAAGAATGGQRIWFGWVGVQIFFVISGYVIACSASVGRARDFVRRRLLRLAPTAWICASATALAVLTTATLPAATIGWRWLCAILFIPVPLQIDGVYWTLSVELTFYLLIAVVLAVAGPRDRRTWIEWTGLALGMASTAFWSVVTLAGADAGTLLASLPLRLTLLPHGVLFALGMQLRTIHARGGSRGRSIALGVFTIGSLLQIAGVVARARGDWDIAVAAWEPYAIFLVGIAVVAGAGRLQRLLLRIASAHTFAMLGLMTYPLYLLHHVIGLAIGLLLVSAGLPGMFGAATAFAFVVILAWLVSVRLEPPLRRGLAGLLDGGFKRFHALGQDMRPTAFPPAG